MRPLRVILGLVISTGVSEGLASCCPAPQVIRSTQEQPPVAQPCPAPTVTQPKPAWLIEVKSRISTTEVEGELERWAARLASLEAEAKLLGGTDGKKSCDPALGFLCDELRVVMPLVQTSIAKLKRDLAEVTNEIEKTKASQTKDLPPPLEKRVFDFEGLLQRTELRTYSLAEHVIYF